MMISTKEVELHYWYWGHVCTKQAYMGLENGPPEVALVDGSFLPQQMRSTSIEGKHVIHGDALSLSIAAASIIAKVPCCILQHVARVELVPDHERLLCPTFRRYVDNCNSDKNNLHMMVTDERMLKQMSIARRLKLLIGFPDILVFSCEFHNFAYFIRFFQAIKGMQLDVTS